MERREGRKDGKRKKGKEVRKIKLCQNEGSHSPPSLEPRERLVILRKGVRQVKLMQTDKLTLARNHRTQAERQAWRQTHRHTARQTGRETDTYSVRQTHKLTL